MPQVINQGNFGKESMASNVKAISVVAHRFRYAAHLIAGFQHRGSDTLLPQFIRGRQSRRPCSNDDSRVLVHVCDLEPADRGSPGGAGADAARLDRWRTSPMAKAVPL